MVTVKVARRFDMEERRECLSVDDATRAGESAAVSSRGRDFGGA
ncbi:MAG: hypothetical protein QOK15_1136 [Nocardioidaceae bacterium]|nr:hypothetical protein [Nocardioidaceae bacterium]